MNDIQGEIKRLADLNLTRQQAAGVLGWNYTTFCKRCARLGMSRLFDDAEYLARRNASILRNKRRAA